MDEGEVRTSRLLFTRCKAVCTKIVDAVHPFQADGTVADRLQSVPEQRVSLHQQVVELRQILEEYGRFQTALIINFKFITFPVFYLFSAAQFDSARPLLTDALLLEALQLLRWMMQTAPMGVFVEETMFSQWFDLLAELAAGRNIHHRTGAPIPEDTRLVAVQIIRQLFEALFSEAYAGQDTLSANQQKVVHIVVSAKWQIPLGFLVSTLLTTAQQHSFKALRECALQTLITIFTAGLHSHNPTLFQFFLPGVSSLCCKIICGDYKAGSRVICLAIRAWAVCLQHTLNDSVLLDLSPRLRQAHEQAMASINTSTASGLLLDTLQGMAARNTHQGPKPLHADAKTPDTDKLYAWLLEARERITVLLQRVYGMASGMGVAQISHERWRVRIALVELASDILQHCRVCLSPCAPLLVDYLIGASHDESAEVREASEAPLTDPALKSIVVSGKHGHVRLWLQLRDRLSAKLISLPRVVRSPNEPQKTLLLRIIHGYLRTIPTSDTVSLFRTSFQRLSVALIQSVEVDTTDAWVIDTHTVSSTAADGGSYHRIRLLHTRAEQSHTLLTSLCTTIGAILLVDEDGDTDTTQNRAQRPAAAPGCVVIDLLVDMIQDPANQFVLKEMVYLMNCLLQGAASSQAGRVDSHHYLAHYLRCVIDCYLQSRLWDAPTMPPADDATTRDPLDPADADQRRSNAILVSLLIRGLGVCARLCGKSFRPHLMRCLYPLLEKMGHHVGMISHDARVALHHIASEAEYTSVLDMVTDNTDYIVDAIASQLRMMSLSVGLRMNALSASPLHINRVLLALLGPEHVNAGKNVLPLLDDTLDHVLATLSSFSADVGTSSDPAHNSQLMSAYISVLRTLVQAISAQVPTPPQTANALAPRGLTVQGVASELQRMCNSIQHIMDYHTRKLQQSDFKLSIQEGDLDLDFSLLTASELEDLAKELALDAADAASEQPPANTNSDTDADADALDDLKAPEESPTDSKAKTAPHDQAMASQILKQTRAFLSPAPLVGHAPMFMKAGSAEADLHRRALVSAWMTRQRILLDIMSAAIKALSEHKDLLLPAVADLWPSFRQVFCWLPRSRRTVLTASAHDAEAEAQEHMTASSHKLLLSAGVQVLTVMVSVDYCAQFLSRRFADDVWPTLQRQFRYFLKQFTSCVGTSLQPFSPYDVKLQSQLLVFMTACARAPCRAALLSPKTLSPLLDLAASYLHEHMHADLHSHAHALILAVASLRPDEVWYVLQMRAQSDKDGCFAVRTNHLLSLLSDPPLTEVDYSLFQ